MARVLDRNLALRVASAVVGLPLLALVFWRTDTRPLLALTALVTAGALWELGGLLQKGSGLRQRVLPMVLGTGVHLAAYWSPASTLAALMVAFVLLAATGLLGVAASELPQAVARISYGVVGLLYVPVLLVALPLFHRDVPFGRLWVVVALGATFVGDTAAFFVGKLFGRHKLAPSISPGKTIEGAIGGLLGCIAFLWIARATFFDTLRPLDCWAFGICAGVLGPAGDLFESLLKRVAGVKDSGRLIPGHGGLLDRIDALLFVGAAGYVYVTWLRR